LVRSAARNQNKLAHFESWGAFEVVTFLPFEVTTFLPFYKHQARERRGNNTPKHIPATQRKTLTNRTHSSTHLKSKQRVGLSRYCRQLRYVVDHQKLRGSSIAPAKKYNKEERRNKNDAVTRTPQRRRNCRRQKGGGPGG